MIIIHDVRTVFISSANLTANSSDGTYTHPTIATSCSGGCEKDLLNRLIAGYGERSARPVQDHSRPIQVFFRYVLSDLIELVRYL